ncbi:hypothetical protein H0H87_011472 [Tephrocybe sp. NHM501043]|nr:hypothetical protein H0H87_011472 [Tephrocybe sp. NHM501043]
MQRLRKSFNGRPPKDNKTSDKTEPKSEPKAEPASNGAGNAFGQIRDAVPGAQIESAIGHIPGGGLATSGFKAAKGLGGLGFAVGSAGATAIQKKRKKSKGGAETQDAAGETPVDGVEPDASVDDDKHLSSQTNQVNEAPVKGQSPQILRSSLSHTVHGNVPSGQAYGLGSTTYFTRNPAHGPDNEYIAAYTIPGAYSPNDLPPVTVYNSVKNAGANGGDSEGLNFSRNVPAAYPSTNGHMQPSGDLAPASDIINTTHQLDREPIYLHRRILG